MLTLTRSRVRTRFIVAAAVVAAVAVSPLKAEAQRRAPQRQVRSVVYVGTYPRYVYYDPWYQWGPYPYPPYGGYYRYGAWDNSTSVRLEVTPRQAEVYVDGFSAGIVDDFDGIFQRLRLQPGGHEITIYLAGYRTIRHNLYLNAGADQKVRLAMEPLRQGETAEPPPPPQIRSAGGDDENPDPRTIPRPGPAPRPRQPPPDPRNEPRAEPQGPEREVRGSFGSLSLRVLPGDAEILVDGERWAAPAGQDRILIQVGEGRHKVEVRKAGFVSYNEDVLIRRGVTLTLNVSLLKG